MGISIADNFNYQGRKPLDARVMFGTIADMVAFPEAGLYDGIEAFVGATGKYYSYNSSNTVDETLGKWRKRSGGHEIEDAEGTAVTEREVMRFGDGFLVEDDTENVKTNVSFDKLASGEIEDVITPKPSVRASYQKYSTDEQIVGEWIDGKPLYEKTIPFTGVTTKNWNHNIDSIENIVDIKGVIRTNTGTTDVIPESFPSTGTSPYYARIQITNAKVYITTNFIGTEWENGGGIIIVRYTKTTD